MGAAAGRCFALRGPAITRAAFILLVVILLPALFYSAYEITTLSTTEELIGEIYNRQLSAILFSLNQYSWDVVGTWRNSLSTLLTRHPDDRSRVTALAGFLERASALSAAFVADSMLSGIRVYLRGQVPPVHQEDSLLAALRAHRDKVDRLARFRQLDYRKIESMTVPMPGGESLLALMFVEDLPGGGCHVAGFVVDEELFVGGLIARVLTLTAGDDFVLAILRQDEVVFSTAPVRADELPHTRDLWILPEYRLGIRLTRTTVDELVRSRFQRNLALIIVLDVVLIAGVWFVYRNIRREMDLVRLKSDFVSNVSHELRTPLALIRMFAETLEMGRITDEKKKQEYYSTILGETERLTRLVNNLLSFSRMEAGRKEYRFSSADVNAVVTSILRTYDAHLRSNGFSPSVELADNLPRVSIDEEAVSEALINLVDNAVKYSNERKHLGIRSGQDGEHVYVEVEDHGVGIAPEHQKKIFEMFYRVSGGLVHTAKGTGLGLTIVKHIMDAHKGSVSVKSTPGAGSTFRLTFPTKLTRTDS